MRRSLKGRATESYSVSTARKRNAAGADAAAFACEYLWNGALSFHAMIRSSAPASHKMISSLAARLLSFEVNPDLEHSR